MTIIPYEGVPDAIRGALLDNQAKFTPEQRRFAQDCPHLFWIAPPPEDGTEDGEADG